MKTKPVVAVAAVCAMAPSTFAWHFQCRWVERIGTTDVVIGGDGATAVFADQGVHRVRLQLGVFDDDAGPAPAGGVHSWREGTLDLTSDGVVPAARRGGCLAPYNQSSRPYSNGNPDEDPFTHLTGIDAYGGYQTLGWFCGPDGTPLPMPQANVVGLNTFSSVFEFRLQNTPETAGVSHMVAGGDLWAVPGWQIVPGSAFPPDCAHGEPGVVTWVPLVPIEEGTLQCTLNIVPGPASWLVALLGITGMRRRRRLGRDGGDGAATSG